MNNQADRPKKEVTLDAEQIEEIRYALLVGLSSYGEIERLCNNFDLLEAGGEPVPEGLVPLHPTGASDTISRFATALHYIN